MENEYCDKFQQLVLLIQQKNGFGFTYPPVETAGPYGRHVKKMPVIEVKLWANGKRTRLYFWLRERSNYRTQRKRNFSFSNSATYFFEAWLSCTQIQANMYSNSKTVDFLEVLNVIFGFLVQKTLLVPIFKVLTRLEVILCTKNFIFLYRDFAAFRNIGEILKMQYFGNRLKLQAQIFRIVQFL